MDDPVDAIEPADPSAPERAEMLARLAEQMHEIATAPATRTLFLSSAWSRRLVQRQLLEGDLEGSMRKLKARARRGDASCSLDLAQSLTELGLIDEYRIYLHPVVLGHGKPYFAGPRPPLRLMANDRIGEDVIRLAYVPA